MKNPSPQIRILASSLNNSTIVERASSFNRDPRVVPISIHKSRFGNRETKLEVHD